MRNAVVLASHLRGEGHFTSSRFSVEPILCVEDHDYWAGVAAHWDSDKCLILLEHDMEVTDGHLEQLLACPHPKCAWAYACHWVSTHLPHDVIAAGTGARDVPKQPDAYYLQGGEEWAAWSAIGLVKLTPEARVGALRREPWNRLELAVEDATRGPWHMHGNASDGWPVGRGGELPEVVHHHW